VRIPVAERDRLGADRVFYLSNRPQYGLLQKTFEFQGLGSIIRRLNTATLLGPYGRERLTRCVRFQFPFLWISAVSQFELNSGDFLSEAAGLLL